MELTSGTSLSNETGVAPQPPNAGGSKAFLTWVAARAADHVARLVHPPALGGWGGHPSRIPLTHRFRRPVAVLVAFVRQEFVFGDLVQVQLDAEAGGGWDSDVAIDRFER